MLLRGGIGGDMSYSSQTSGTSIPVSQTSIPVFGSRKRKASSIPDECSTKTRRTSNDKNNKSKTRTKWNVSHLVSTSTLSKSPICKSIVLEIDKDVSTGSQAIIQYVSGTWWSWDAGSGLLFWRWPTKQSRAAARDGFEVYVSGRLPHFERKQPQMKEEVCLQLALKVGAVRKKYYIAPIYRALRVM